MDKKEAKEQQAKPTLTESKDKDGNTVWTATYTGEVNEKIFDDFFGEKKTEADKKFDSVAGFIFTYLYPAFPFLQLADKVESKYAKKQGWIKLFAYLIPRLIVGAPFFLSGMLYVGGLFNEGWRLRTTNGSFGLIVILSYLFTSLNPQLTQQAVWATLIAVYVFGYYQLFKNKQK